MQQHYWTHSAQCSSYRTSWFKRIFVSYSQNFTIKIIRRTPSSANSIIVQKSSRGTRVFKGENLRKWVNRGRIWHVSVRIELGRIAGVQVVWTCRIVRRMHSCPAKRSFCLRIWKKRHGNDAFREHTFDTTVRNMSVTIAVPSKAARCSDRLCWEHARFQSNLDFFTFS
jgi:hypothetical protein